MKLGCWFALLLVLCCLTSVDSYKIVRGRGRQQDAKHRFQKAQNDVRKGRRFQGAPGNDSPTEEPSAAAHKQAGTFSAGKLKRRQALVQKRKERMQRRLRKTQEYKSKLRKK